MINVLSNVLLIIKKLKYKCLNKSLINKIVKFAFELYAMKFVNKKSFLLLKISIISVFIGRAYQHLFWDAPFRTFFWDEGLLKTFVEGTFSIDWQSYVTSIQTDAYVDWLVQIFGFLYLASAIAVLIYNFKSKFFKSIIIVGGLGLVFLSFLQMKERFYQLGQFFEYSLQFGIPFVFIFYQKPFIKNNLTFILKILIAIVFVSHGLYAVGYYPVPGYFLGMVIDILGFSEDGARLFLLVVGILDFIVSLLIFIPKISKYALFYAFIWGLLTSFARIFAGFSLDYFWELLHLNLYQVVYRLPHALIPLMLLYFLKENKKLYK